MTDQDITRLIRQIQNGRNDHAAGDLWDQYFERLMQVARRNLRQHARRDSDEEDVAISAMHSFFRAAEAGRLDKLKDRSELWKVLVTITIRKANRQIERAMAAKRGSGGVRGESVFHGVDESSGPGLAGVPDEPFLSNLFSECGSLLEQLEDDTQRQIALLRMEGWNLDEISERLEISPSTVKRKLARIKSIWQHTEDHPDE